MLNLIQGLFMKRDAGSLSVIAGCEPQSRAQDEMPGQARHDVVRQDVVRYDVGTGLMKGGQKVARTRVTRVLRKLFGVGGGADGGVPAGFGALPE